MDGTFEFCAGIFNESFAPVVDGVANVTFNYAKWLKRKNVRSIVVTPFVPDYKYDEEFEILTYFSLPQPVRRPYRLGLPRLDSNFLKKLRALPFDLVHAHSPFSAGQIGLKTAREKKIPIIATFHTKYYDDFIQAVKIKSAADMLVKWIIDYYSKCDFVWTPNKSSAETLKSYGFKKNIEVAANGNDYEAPADPARAREFINGKYGLKDSDNILVYIGQHVWQKNLKMTIESLSILKKENLPFKMIFVGRGDAEPEMKKTAEEMGLDNNVIFAGLISDRDLIRQLYTRMDLFIFPSLYDTSSLVVQEAAAAGKPSIMVKGSNTAEGSIDNFNCFHTENSAEAMALVIKKALSDRNNLARVGKNAQESLNKPWEKAVEEVKERYKEILKNWKRRKIVIKGSNLKTS